MKLSEKFSTSKFVPDVISQMFGRQMLEMKKQSPHILFAAGVIGVGVSTVLACRATLKLSRTLDDIKEDVDSVKELQHSVDTSPLPPAEYQKDMLYVYGKGSLQLCKLYGPAVLVGAASIALLTGSHIQLTRRNSALMAAYAAVSEAYEKYRDRVRERLGVEEELDIYHAATPACLEDADGKKTDVKIVDPDGYSPYARFFDEGSRFFEKDPELNRMYIQCQQNYANDVLRARGHVFLNEVYDWLGIERSVPGAVVGWVMGGNGDDYIDFGIFQAFKQRIDRAVPAYLLDFNVDGVIYDKIEGK